MIQVWVTGYGVRVVLCDEEQEEKLGGAEVSNDSNLGVCQRDFQVLGIQNLELRGDLNLKLAII